MKRLLTGLIMLVCFAWSTSHAQGQDYQSDTSAVQADNAVKDTISKVHAAISSLDISKMEALWFHNAMSSASGVIASPPSSPPPPAHSTAPSICSASPPTA